jgi:hypothetical protein
MPLSCPLTRKKTDSFRSLTPGWLAGSFILHSSVFPFRNALLQNLQNGKPKTFPQEEAKKRAVDLTLLESNRYLLCRNERSGEDKHVRTKRTTVGGQGFGLRFAYSEAFRIPFNHRKAHIRFTLPFHRDGLHQQA